MSNHSHYQSNQIRVGWFASGFVARSASGTSYVAKQTILFLLTHHRKNFEIVLFSKNQDETNFLKNSLEFSGAKIIELPKVKIRFMSSSRQFYKFCRKREPVVDILHFSTARLYPYFWRFPSRKFISTFHAAGDVTIKPGKFVLSRHIYNLIVRLQWKKLDAIIAVSEFAKNEIISHYKIAKPAIRIIPPGADAFLSIGSKPIPRLENVGHLISILGRWQNHKNVGFALKQLDKINECNVERFHLALVGRSNVLGREAVEKIISSVSNSEISIFEYLEPGELNWLFLNSKLVIIPSLNEGFGLPSFEAFAGGANILVHSGTPASTILKNQPGVYFCDMTNPQAFSSKVLEIMEDLEELDKSQRTQLLRELKLTWEDYGKNIANLYLENTVY